MTHAGLGMDLAGVRYGADVQRGRTVTAVQPIRQNAGNPAVLLTVTGVVR